MPTCRACDASKLEVHGGSRRARPTLRKLGESGEAARTAERGRSAACTILKRVKCQIRGYFLGHYTGSGGTFRNITRQVHGCKILPTVTRSKY